MRSRTFALTVLIAALILAACGGSGISSSGAQPYASLKGNAARGKEKYASVCSPCHGEDARGIPNLGKDLVGGDFSKKATEAELIALTIKGRPASDPANITRIDMPPRGGNPALSDQQVADIIAYLRSLQK